MNLLCLSCQKDRTIHHDETQPVSPSCPAAFFLPTKERAMDKWTYRELVTRDLMLFGVALEALTLYPNSPAIFLTAVPLAMVSLLHLCGILSHPD
jgi:hypothetical protein